MSAGFVFVNFNNPEEAEHGDFKKKVRSQAATHSHRVAPRRGVKFARYEPRPTKVTNAAVSPDSTSSTSDASRSTVLPSPDGEAPNSAIAKLVKTDVRPSEPTRHPSPSPALRTGQQSVPGSLGLSIQTSPRSALRRLHAANKTTNQANIGLKRSRSRSSYEQPNKRSAHHNSGDLAALIPYGKLPDPSYLDSGPRDPFDTYPVPYQPWFGWLLDFWYSGTLPKSNRLVKTTPERMNTYITWSRRFELTEPALFYTSLFLASGIPVANGSMGVEKALWLRGQAVRALNEALDDPERAISNAVISAVGKIALHEHIYGDRQAAHRIHRPAQQRMIAMRGGIEKLGLPSITLQLMTWYDALMAAEMGTTAYFADLPKKMALQSYSNEEAVRVTNESSPHRYRHPGYGTMKSPKLIEMRTAGTSSGMQPSCAPPD